MKSSYSEGNYPWPGVGNGVDTTNYAASKGADGADATSYMEIEDDF